MYYFIKVVRILSLITSNILKITLSPAWKIKSIYNDCESQKLVITGYCQKEKDKAKVVRSIFCVFGLVICYYSHENMKCWLFAVTISVAFFSTRS